MPKAAAAGDARGALPGGAGAEEVGVALFAGKGSDREFRKEMACPDCGRRGVYDVGSAVLGEPSSSAADVMFEVHYECPHCGHEWAGRS